MAKKIVDENGNTYVQKKPFYKRVWFWILAIIVIFIIIGSSSSSKDTKSSENSASSSKTNKQTKESSSIESKPKVSAEYTAALNKANTYASVMSMSKAAIYQQLTSDAGEKFPVDAAQYAIDNVKADYNKNALSKAKTYQKQMSMSTDAIKEQLISDSGEKFTQEEADYAIQHLNN